VFSPEYEGVVNAVVLFELELFVQYNEAFFKELFKVDNLDSVNKSSVDELTLYQLETLE
jgi:hypothetical protein